MKRVLVLSLLVALFLASCDVLKTLWEYDIYASFYTPTSTVTQTATVMPKETLSPTHTVTPVMVCKVKTGVDAGNLNLRTGAGTMFAVKAVLSEGEILTLTGQSSNGWVEAIRADGTSGYVNYNLISCLGD